MREPAGQGHVQRDRTQHGGHTGTQSPAPRREPGTRRRVLRKGSGAVVMESAGTLMN